MNLRRIDRFTTQGNTIMVIFANDTNLTHTTMEINDTIYHVGDSIRVVTHHVAKETHGLDGYMTETSTSLSWKGFVHRIYDPGWDYISNLTNLGYICAFLIILILVLTFIRSKKIPYWLRSISLKSAFISVFIYGFFVYDYGMCTGEYISLLTNAPLALVYAFKIFLFDSDVSEIHSAFHESWVYSFNFALVHFFAAIISTLFLIKAFGYNIISRFRLWWNSLIPKKVENTYIFFGFNDAAFHLLDSIKKHYGKGSDYRVIIVRTNENKTEESDGNTGFHHIFDFLSLRTKELDQLRELGFMSIGTFANLSSIEIEDKPSDVFGRVLKMRSLKRFIKHGTKEKIHLFSLSENETDNIHLVNLLLNDITVISYKNQSLKKIILYCHARYNSVHRVIEDQHLSSSVCVKVVDSSHISVEELKQKPILQPVNYVKVETDATVSTPFNALVIGFSEVGEDSSRFLYEFGAFVDSSSPDGNVRRSPFHLTVIDKEMDNLAGTFVANAPKINPSLPFLKKDPNPDSLITLLKMDCRSVEFYDNLKNWIKTLNYIVIATENDELNLSLGIRIFKLATRYRDKMDKLCILIRAHKDEDIHIRKIVDYYNHLWEAQKAAQVEALEKARKEALEEQQKAQAEGREVKPWKEPVYNGKAYTQHRIKCDVTIKEPVMHVFGLDKDTYTFDNIIDDTLERRAISFKESYQMSSDANYVKEKKERINEYNETISDPEIRELAIANNLAWYTEANTLLQINMSYSKQDSESEPHYSPSLCGVQTLRRTQGQDFANALHTTTKKLIAEKALGINESYDWTQYQRIVGTTTYILSTGETVDKAVARVLEVLAQTEHLRWNASHELMGYIFGGKDGSRHEIKLHHACLTSWEGVKGSQHYDYNVVDITLNIKIIMPDNQTDTND